MRARRYDPYQGVFLSPDPLGYVDSFDEWLYAAGDPFNLWDPWGLKAGSNGAGNFWVPCNARNNFRVTAGEQTSRSMKSALLTAILRPDSPVWYARGGFRDGPEALESCGRGGRMTERRLWCVSAFVLFGLGAGCGRELGDMPPAPARASDGWVEAGHGEAAYSLVREVDAAGIRLGVMAPLGAIERLSFDDTRIVLEGTGVVPNARSIRAFTVAGVPAQSLGDAQIRVSWLGGDLAALDRLAVWGRALGGWEECPVVSRTDGELVAWGAGMTEFVLVERHPGVELMAAARPASVDWETVPSLDRDAAPSTTAGSGADKAIVTPAIYVRTPLQNPPTGSEAVCATILAGSEAPRTYVLPLAAGGNYRRDDIAVEVPATIKVRYFIASTSACADEVRTIFPTDGTSSALATQYGTETAGQSCETATGAQCSPYYVSWYVTSRRGVTPNGTLPCPGSSAFALQDLNSNRVLDACEPQEDLCPDDPLKSEPGACGCGVSDDDSDSDGTPDCVDACPDWAGGVSPGPCGCVYDGLNVCGECGAPRDSDDDTVPDCVDACPFLPGGLNACGECGVADDADSDGAPDCVDVCPDDPLNDPDDDGVCESSDNCPGISNPNVGGEFSNNEYCAVFCTHWTPGGGYVLYPTAGQCIAACASLPCTTQVSRKVTCGFPDGGGSYRWQTWGFSSLEACEAHYDNGLCYVLPTLQADSDGDGAGDACDLCEGDDFSGDADGDGLCDDIDPCPLSTVGLNICGECGVPVDTDGDGVPDCLDACPNDVGGWNGCYQCGESDRDGDGVLNCHDACPDDPLNDPDQDGVCDDVDNCPGVANAPVRPYDSEAYCAAWCPEFSPGGGHRHRFASLAACTAWCMATGCQSISTAERANLCPNVGQGYADTFRYWNTGSGGQPFASPAACDAFYANGLCVEDSTVWQQPDFNADGVGDACDGCDTGVLTGLTPDTDGDGYCDPVDPCPLTVGQTPGACGCGVPEIDSDDDGILDCVDACPLDPGNDADEDGVCGDVDNCPEIANPATSSSYFEAWCRFYTPGGPASTYWPTVAACVAAMQAIYGTCASHSGVAADDCDTWQTLGWRSQDHCVAGYAGLACDSDHATQLDSDADGVGDACDICIGDDASGDTDDDGACDAADGCPMNPDKTAPDTCGCGTSGADDDRDGYGDCDDRCPGTPDPQHCDETFQLLFQACAAGATEGDEVARQAEIEACTRKIACIGTFNGYAGGARCAATCVEPRRE